MNKFDIKLLEQFTNFKVTKPDHPKHLNHLYADYVELITLFSNQSYITKDTILDRIKDTGETGINEIVLSEANDEINENDLFADSNTSKRNDLKENWVDNLFDVIRDRSSIFKNDYPFDYSENRGLILKENIVDKNELYIFLLISSNLDLFNKVANDLTTDFEDVSYFVLKNFLGKAIVKKFGKRSEYSGKAKEKIKALAIDMKLEINEYSLSNVSEQNLQERGLDIVAWFPFTDYCPNIITILGQCACGKDWPQKYHDTERFATYMRYFRQKPIHAMFIPYSLISRSSDWFYCSDDIQRNTMMFERKRILELFDNNEEFKKLPSKRIVEECVRYSEDII